MTSDYEKVQDAERRRERENIVQYSPMSNLMPLLQWVAGAGIFSLFAWLIIQSINSLNVAQGWFV